jgi:hypothetical protein
LRAVDLDGDQVKEIIVPLTSFYEFQDKTSISQIPLPEIIFKYDSDRQQYLPANSSFKEYFVKDQENFQHTSTDNELEYRSGVLHAMTVLIYCGRRDEAWRRFDQFYKLPDRSEMKRRINKVLQGDQVYNFIYNSAKV